MIRYAEDAEAMIPPMHFTKVGDHSLRERPLMETAALGSADATQCGHGLRRSSPAAPKSRDIGWCGGGITRKLIV